MKRLAIPIACLLSLAFAPVAHGALRADATLQTIGERTHVEVALVSDATLTSRTKPNNVSVKAGKKTYKLKKQRGGYANGGTWRSSGYKGAAAERLRKYVGKRIRVRVKTRSRTQNLSTGLTLPIADPGPGGGGSTGGGGGSTGGGGGTTGGGGSTGPFEAPGRELSGEETRPFLERYFVNSRFTDCPAGWPACAVEERYTHCASGEQRYQRLTPSSGSDINSYGTYFNVNAVVHADGSWAVSYDLNSYGNTTHYDWETAKDGTTYGLYTGPSGAQQRLGPLLWVQGGC